MDKVSMTEDGAESVWDYPRPPRIEAVRSRLVVEVHGRVVAETTDGLRVLETSHPPTYYIPPADVARELLQPGNRTSVCEFKGPAVYWDLMIGRYRVADIAWSYPQPWRGYERLADHFCFYASRCDRCSVDGEVVAAQPGDFYGGWITRGVRGPFKGGPGTAGW